MTETEEIKLSSETKSELSTDINTLTAEINAYKRVAGEAIFEIGRRLKHVKENDLAHGEWTEWLESVEMSTSQANRFMKVAEELDGNFLTTRNIGVEALYYIATLPESERNQTHTTSKGEEKTPDEMTVKELREVKRQLKEEQRQREEAEKKAERAQSTADSAQRSESIMRKKYEDLEDKEPEVRYETRTEYIEKVPDDYEDLRKENEELRDKYGVGVHKKDSKSREELYREFADDLDKLRDKYSSLVAEAQKIKSYTDMDGNVGRALNKFNDFWMDFSKSLFSDETIIEMESVQ